MKNYKITIGYKEVICVNVKASDEKEAKDILEKFADALGKFHLNDEQSFIIRKDFQREEKNMKDSSPDFKERILLNAPFKDSDFIIVEKGSWKK